jgi:hypothetical protein
MKNKITIEDIPENEVRLFMFMQEFNMTKKFLFALLFFSAIGFLVNDSAGIAWAIVIVALFKFILIPLITLIGLGYSKRNEPEEYEALIDTQKRKYYRKQYAE